MQTSKLYGKNLRHLMVLINSLHVRYLFTLLHVDVRILDYHQKFNPYNLSIQIEQIRYNRSYAKKFHKKTRRQSKIERQRVDGGGELKFEKVDNLAWKSIGAGHQPRTRISFGRTLFSNLT